ncbi:SRPBCC family protein [Nocardioides sp. GCM10027113]|uniref:SRPBCC family protein n=1 Tax=unclassified Nocardioides TaxID=2615069 RepID=UPI00361DBC4E
MTKELHRRSVHIDAPVDKVFDYVKVPENFLMGFGEDMRRHSALAEVHLTPDGLGSTFRMMGRMFLLFHMEWVFTREEFVPNERIVDHANLGGVWTHTFAPDDTGTTYSLAFGWAGPATWLGEMADRFSWNGDEDLDAMLARVKEAVET